ncbi:histidinol-phosphate transaminase [Paenibacillus hamazuiensis]|uniref:histidinol-phosphate transaminase n=1 Tax=Paenibacillus hamazuiensis TaxID=2936508 RepID=UPI00200D269E|nr:histidinol-phosphate transaminase [Paenibacillus hamazuiensis]
MPSSSFVPAREALRKLKPYSPGKPIWEVQQELGLTHVVKLASNENPLGASPKALQAIRDSLADIHRYPDSHTSLLKTALSEKYGFSPNQFIAGNGADELITLISETFLEAGDEIVVPAPSFSEYEFGALLMGAEPIIVPLRDGYRYDVDDLLQAVTPRTKLIYLCSPNNPTGTYLPKPELERLLGALPPRVLVVYDSAYAHYATEADYCDGMEFVRRGFPLIVLQTFSKIYGLAGIRVGFAVAPEPVTSSIAQVKEPFNVNALAQAAAAAALQDDAHVEASRRVNEAGRTQLYAGLQKLGVRFTESMSNFVLVDLETNAKSIYDKLMAKGVIVRYGAIWGLPDHLRITVGTFEENEALLRALEDVLG